MGAQMTKQDVQREIQEAFGRVPEWMQQLPETAMVNVWGLMRDFYLGETKLPNKYKELIGLGVSGATRCRYCALFHTEAARMHGATDEEISEASAMAGVTMLSSTFLNAQQVDYERFRKETQEIVAYVRQQKGKQPRGQKPEHGARA